MFSSRKNQTKQFAKRTSRKCNKRQTLILYSTDFLRQKVVTPVWQLHPSLNTHPPALKLRASDVVWRKVHPMNKPGQASDRTRDLQTKPSANDKFDIRTQFVFQNVFETNAKTRTFRNWRLGRFWTLNHRRIQTRHFKIKQNFQSSVFTYWWEQKQTIEKS
jgi:hypothetical protein